MKIFTYCEPINFSFQDELISLWKKSWEGKGFEPIVLNQTHAKQHAYYEEFNNKIDQVVKIITGAPLSSYGKACYMRWLAYATQANEKFFVADYDVINNNFTPFEPEDSLCFYDRFCPCFASGTPSQFYNLCKAFIDVSLCRTQQIKETYKELKYTNFHDQDFLVCNCCPVRNKDAQTIYQQYNFDFKSKKTIISRPEKNSVYGSSVQLVHFSHNCVCNIYEGTHQKVDEQRIKAIVELLNQTSKSITNSEMMLSDCIRDFAPISGGIRNQNKSLNELGKEITLIGIKNLLPSINQFFDLINLELPKAEQYDESKKTKISENLKELFNRHGTDKSVMHDYHLVYGEIFSKLNVLGNLNILEIGIGSQNPTVPSRMSSNFTVGSSIRAFKEYFPNAQIFGADIDKDVLFSEDRIKTSYLDQLDSITFEEMHKNFNCPSYDLIIDDGLHSFAANLNTLNFALKYTKKGGAIVLEDLGKRGNVWNMLTALLVAKGYNAKLINSKGLMLVIFL